MPIGFAELQMHLLSAHKFMLLFDGCVLFAQYLASPWQG